MKPLHGVTNSVTQPAHDAAHNDGVSKKAFAKIAFIALQFLILTGFIYFYIRRSKKAA
jgi:hypothetical protein